MKKKAENSIGIILNINISTYRAILFDKFLGKINIPMFQKFNTSNNLCNGALISYSLNIENEKAKIQGINIIDVPFLIAKKNILFFHHIIELCNFFVPIGLPSNELFEMLNFAFYSFDEELNNLQKQKIFLTKFFLSIGNYPENEALKSYIYEIMKIPIDTVINTQIDLKDEKELNLWILKCMNMNPYFKYFKTTNFLNKFII